MKSQSPQARIANTANTQSIGAIEQQNTKQANTITQVEQVGQSHVGQITQNVVNSVKPQQHIEQNHNNQTLGTQPHNHQELNHQADDENKPTPLTEEYYNKITNGLPKISFQDMRNILGKMPMTKEEVVFLQEHPDWIEKILENNLDVTELMESLEKIPLSSAEVSIDEGSQEFQGSATTQKMQTNTDLNSLLKNQNEVFLTLENVDYNGNPLPQRSITRKFEDVDYHGNIIPTKQVKAWYEYILNPFGDVTGAFADGERQSTMYMLGEVRNAQLAGTTFTMQGNNGKEWNFIETIAYQTGKFYKDSPLMLLEAGGAISGGALGGSIGGAVGCGTGATIGAGIGAFTGQQIVSTVLDTYNDYLRAELSNQSLNNVEIIDSFIDNGIANILAKKTTEKLGVLYNMLPKQYRKDFDEYVIFCANTVIEESLDCLFKDIMPESKNKKTNK